MATRKPTPTGTEQFFDTSEIIVSKTDCNGRITYANDVFLRVSGYSEEELFYKAHSIIRHPDMPRAVFQLLWDTIEAGNEIFAYVNNLCKNGDHYWVFAHVTPSFDTSGQLVGYHSSRRVPNREAVKTIAALYQEMLAEEERHEERFVGIQKSMALLLGHLSQSQVQYDEFIFALQG